MTTDPVHEGKSKQGMIDLTRKGTFPKGAAVLYAHLGGAPAMNGYSYFYKGGRETPPDASRPQRGRMRLAQRGAPTGAWELPEKPELSCWG